jgi:hypothetical protein
MVFSASIVVAQREPALATRLDMLDNLATTAIYVSLPGSWLYRNATLYRLRLQLYRITIEK